MAMGGLLLARGLGAHELALFPPMLQFNSQTLNIPELMQLLADVLLILATIWTVFSGIEYTVGALPLFQNRQAAKQPNV